MNQTGMTRLPTPVVKSGPEVYVLHLIPEQRRLCTQTSRWRIVVVKCIKRTRGSAAIWRGPKWSKLHATDYYPESLR